MEAWINRPEFSPVRTFLLQNNRSESKFSESVARARLLPDDELQLDLETFSRRHGIAYGMPLPQMLVNAEEALFEIDEALREIGLAF